MDLQLYVKEGEQLKVLKVPEYVVKDLLRDRLSESELNRIRRVGEITKQPRMFKSGSVFADFDLKLARCFNAKINLEFLETKWKVEEETGLMSF